MRQNLKRSMKRIRCFLMIKSVASMTNMVVHLSMAVDHLPEEDTEVTDLVERDSTGWTSGTFLMISLVRVLVVEEDSTSNAGAISPLISKSLLKKAYLESPEKLCLAKLQPAIPAMAQEQSRGPNSRNVQHA